MDAQKSHTLIAQRNYLRLRKSVRYVVQKRHTLCFLVVIVCCARNALMNIYADQVEGVLYVGSLKELSNPKSWVSCIFQISLFCISFERAPGPQHETTLWLELVHSYAQWWSWELRWSLTCPWKWDQFDGREHCCLECLHGTWYAQWDCGRNYAWRGELYKNIAEVHHALIIVHQLRTMDRHKKEHSDWSWCTVMHGDDLESCVGVWHVLGERFYIKERCCLPSAYTEHGTHNLMSWITF
jgi:hypothetical protein